MPDWLSVILRSLGAITVLFIMTRLLGTKQISQMNFFHYIVGITVGSIAAFMSVDLEGHYLHGILGILVWTLIPFMMEFISMKSKAVRDFLQGKGRILIKDGKILEDNLKKSKYTIDELMEQLREKNVFRVADVEFAVMEPDGRVSVMVKKEQRPITPSDLGVKVGPEQEPQTVMMDGKVMDEPLATIGLNREWLETELEKLGVAKENVFLAQVDSYGQLYVDLYDDQLKVPSPSQKEALLATLKKCQADLELFGLDTESDEAKILYARCANQLKDIIDKTTPFLQR